MDEKYIVLDCKGFTGLTVGSYSRKPGYVFYRKEWNFGDDSLNAAIAVGRCKLVEQEIKEEKKVKADKSEMKSDKSEKIESEEKGFKK